MRPGEESRTWTLRLEEPLIPDYTIRHRDRYKAIVTELIPARGASSWLEGELVRAVDKLWFEAQDNGNINWDEGFEYFCDLLEEWLLEPGVLDEADLRLASRSLKIIRHCGRIAYLNKPEWNRHDSYDRLLEQRPEIRTEPEGCGIVPDFAYVHSDIYRHLVDCVVAFAARNSQPIPYRAPDWLYR